MSLHAPFVEMTVAVDALKRSLSVPQSHRDATAEIYAMAKICGFVGLRCFMDIGCMSSISTPPTSDTLNANQNRALHTFRQNMEHFCQLWTDTTATLVTLQSAPLIAEIRADLHCRSVDVFCHMCENFLDQMRISSGSFSDTRTLVGLLEGDLKGALKLVPSRRLARQLHMSDQKLRREIYLARQRALHKDVAPKRSLSREDRQSDGATEDAVEDFRDDVLMEHISVPTCASPPSASSSVSVSCWSDNELESRVESRVESRAPCINDDWLDIETWLNSELFEDAVH